MLDNKVGMQNRKMVGFINMGEFFYRARKAERWGVCVQTLGQEKNREDKVVNHGGILKGTLGS